MKPFEAAILLALISFYRAIACPNGYEDGGDGRCYKYSSQPTVHSQAEATCMRDNARLVHIHNAFENTVATHHANGMDMWIGLRCTSNSYSYCYWDDDGTSDTSYNNFANGVDINIGYCVFMGGSGVRQGRWFSASCEAMYLPFMCSYDNNILINCGDYRTYNGRCYKTYTTSNNVNYTTAESTCQNECGHLSSIHDLKENNYIVASVENAGGNIYSNFAYIGIQRTGNTNTWNDGSAVDYTNFDHVSKGSEPCAALALYDDRVAAGKWMYVNCSDIMSFVCKRELTNCAPTAAPVSTIVPPQCQTQYLDGNGTIYSPAYPAMYPDIPQECEYRLSVPTGNVILSFKELQLDVNSRILFYSDFFTTNAFNNFNGNSGNGNGTGNVYVSSTDELRVVFSADRLPTATSKMYRWSANFVSMPTFNNNSASGCNATIYAPGQISSLNYPNNYPDSSSCYYHLAVDSGKRVYLQFGPISTYNSYDSIYVYDGDSTSSPYLARFYGSYPAGQHVQSTGNRMLVTFLTDNSGNYPGWSGTFVAV